MPRDTFDLPSSDGGCACGVAGCDGNHDHQNGAPDEELAFQPTVSTPPVFASDDAVCTCASHDPIAAAYEASLADSPDVLPDFEPNAILSSQSEDPLILNAPGEEPIPDGLQFYLGFTLDWQGVDREEFQMMARVINPLDKSMGEIRLRQFYGTDQVQLTVRGGEQDAEFVVAGIMHKNAVRDWEIQITDEGDAQLWIDGNMRGERFVGDISEIPRDNIVLGNDPYGPGTRLWGEYSNVRADLDGDGQQDVVQIRTRASL